MAIIKNFGLRWSRSKVDWGTRGKGNAGSLKGQKTGQKSSGEVDFRDQIGIYVLYEENFSPVYVGQAGMGNARLYDRLKTHRADHLHDRWSHFSWFGFRNVNKDCSLSDKHDPEASTSISYKDALGEIEGILIQVLEPRLNRQGPRWRRIAKEYIQIGVVDEETTNERILEEIESLAEEIDQLKAQLS